MHKSFADLASQLQTKQVQLLVLVLVGYPFGFVFQIAAVRATGKTKAARWCLCLFGRVIDLCSLFGRHALIR